MLYNLANQFLFILVIDTVDIQEPKLKAIKCVVV